VACRLGDPASDWYICAPTVVMDEPGRDNTSLNYMWVARGGAPGAPVILHHYAPSRGPEVAQQMLGDFEGFLQTDGCEVYDRRAVRT